MKVVLVGHCGFDASSLTRIVREAIPGAVVERADSDAELDALGDAALLLVNRVLDGGFAASDGVELIARVRGEGGRARCMLISNYEEAQRRAVGVGAAMGFGKSASKSDAAERVRAAVGEG